MWETQALDGKRRKLTSIQAAMIINVVYNLYALDKLGTIHGLQSLSLARDMRLFEGNTHITSERVRHARNFTAWCLFNIDRSVAHMVNSEATAGAENTYIVISAGNYSARFSCLSRPRSLFLALLQTRLGMEKFGADTP